jgi:hypothetical protein
MRRSIGEVMTASVTALLDIRYKQESMDEQAAGK